MGALLHSSCSLWIWEVSLFAQHLFSKVALSSESLFSSTPKLQIAIATQFSFARVRSQGNSTARVWFSLGLFFRGIKSQSSAMEACSFKFQCCFRLSLPTITAISGLRCVGVRNRNIRWHSSLSSERRCPDFLACRERIRIATHVAQSIIWALNLMIYITLFVFDAVCTRSIILKMLDDLMPNKNAWCVEGQ